MNRGCIILIAMVVAIYGVSRFQMPSKSLNLDVTAVQAQTETGSAIKQDPPLDPIKNKNSLSSESKRVITNCLKASPTFAGQSSAEDFLDLDQLLNRARGGERAEVSTNYMNLHGETNTGIKRRLHIRKPNQDEPSRKMSIQVFAVAPDGFPTLERSLTEKYRTLSVRGAIERFRREMPTITSDQRSESYLWSTGESAEIRRNNGRISTFQIFLPHGVSLGCNSENGTCRCLE